MIPNATTFLSQLPGTRVTAVSGGVTAPLCIREAIIKRGNMSDSGLSAQPVASLLFLTLAFTKPRDVADLITIDSVPAIVTGTELVMFGQIIRAHMLLLSDSCTFDGAPLACQINAISAAAEMFSTGIQQDETETLFTHTDLLPEGSDLPRFSARYSSSTSWSGGCGGRPPQVPRITARVPVAMPERSIQWKVGFTPTTTMDPGGVGFNFEQKGWSIHPPARASR